MDVKTETAARKGRTDMDAAEIVIDVRDIKKQFKSYRDKAASFKERFVNPSRTKHESVTVLRGISFQVRRGEAVGIIGKNGCGKSTTLKLLTRILYPTEGSIRIKGRVSSLIELGAGFHPDMTGRENIYTNASIFGLTRKEVDQRLGDIVRFSELEEFIDQPVRTYSSGMYMRLAFAVAINVNADVLLIDEILAVGDSAFQKKCFEKLKEIKAHGTTIVIVSHSMDQMYKICDRLIWIENGLIKDDGIPKFIGEEYLAAMEGRRLDRIELENRQKKEELERQIQAEQERLRQEQERERKAQEKEEKEQKERERKAQEEAQRAGQLAEMERVQKEMARNETAKALTPYYHPSVRRQGNGMIRYTQVAIVNSEGKSTNRLVTGEKYTIHMEYEAQEAGMYTKFVMGITRDDGTYCYGTSVNMNEIKNTSLQKNGTVEFVFINGLLKGKYVLDLWINTPDGCEYDSIYSLMSIDVETEPYQERGIFSMEHKWLVDGEEYTF